MDASTSDISGPLTPAVFHILLTLAGGDAHGYAIMSEIDRLTNGRIRLGPGTLYRSIYKMTLDRLIEEVGGRAATGDERRLTYRITRKGLEVARGEAQRLERLVRVARRRGLLGEAAEPRRGARS